MIDFYDAEFSFSLDPKVYQSILGHAKASRPSKTYRRKLSSPRWMAQVEALIGPDVFRLRVCPAKVLGTWNSYGSNDLRDLVSLTAPMVLATAGHVVTEKQKESISAGEYTLKEVHIAEAFHLVHYSQDEFIRLIAYACGEHLRIQWAHRGTGIIVKPQNRRVSAYLYSKIEEFMARGYSAYADKLEVAPKDRRPWMLISRNAHLLAAALGPRLELRFGDQFFRRNKLAKGHAWNAETAGKLYESELGRLELPATIAPMFKREEAESKLSPQQLNALKLWHHGEHWQSFGSPSTCQRHRAAIREALGIDIAQPSAKLLGGAKPLDVQAVINLENIVGTEFDMDDPDNQELMRRVLHDRK